jgi:hypothetical protein
MSDDGNDENNEQTPLTNQFVDKVTLELLMNKNHYNRYISQSDPKKHQEYLEHLEKIKKYKNAIMNTTKDFLDNSNHMVTTEVNEAYDYYVKTLIRHFDCKRIECFEDFNIEKDDDVLFGNMDENSEEEEQTPMKSYWGKHKVQKKSSSFGFPMNYIPRVKDT